MILNWAVHLKEISGLIYIKLIFCSNRADLHNHVIMSRTHVLKFHRPKRKSGLYCASIKVGQRVAEIIRTWIQRDSACQQHWFDQSLQDRWQSVAVSSTISPKQRFATPQIRWVRVRNLGCNKTSLGHTLLHMRYHNLWLCMNRWSLDSHILNTIQ